MQSRYDRITTTIEREWLAQIIAGTKKMGAYGWAFVKPIRKLYYNMTITSVSVIVAFVVGRVEALGLLAGHFHFKGWLWEGSRSA
jgi:high-affinity nickel permease